MLDITVRNRKGSEQYLSILLDWQGKINLISNNTIKDAWVRHILDSLQVNQYIKGENNYILDLGSGAGLPGMVLAINDDRNYYELIDSNFKKTVFLNYVKEQIGLQNITITNNRIEDFQPGRLYDYVVSRALTSLSNLLKMVDVFLKPDGVAILQKGKSYQQEILDARKNLLLKSFNLEIKDSKIDSTTKILLISRNINGC